MRRQLERAWVSVRTLRSQLRETERKYHEMAETLPEVLYEADMTGRVVYYNAAALRIFGFTRADFKRGVSVIQLMAPEERERATRRMRALLRGEMGKVGEYMAMKKSGERFSVIARSRPVMRDGRVAGFRGVVIDASPLKQAQKALQEKSRQQEVLLANIPDMAWMKDSKGRFIMVNKAWERFTGILASRVIGKTELDLIPRHMARKFHLDDFRAMRSRKPLYIQEEVPARQGDMRWLETAKIPIVGKDGGVLGLTGIARDITERRKADLSIRDSEQRLAAIINFLPDATFVVDVKGRVIAWNRAIEAMTGIDSKDMLGKGNKAYSIPFYGKRRPILIDLVLNPKLIKTAKYQSLQRIGQALVGETFCPGVQPGGANLWGKATPIYNAKGELVGAIESVRDVTKLRRAERALKESEERYRSLVETIIEVIWETDTEGRYRYISPQIKQVLGYEPREVVGKTCFDFMPPEDAKRLRSWFARLGREKKPFVNLENTVIHKDGRMVDLETDGVPFFSQSGELLGYRGADRDISERKRLKEEILRTSEWEQRRIGQELHDGLIQNLAGIAIVGNSLSQRLQKKAPEEALDAAKISESVREAIAEARSVARGLVPVDVDANGLMVALRNLAAKVRQRSGLRCVFQCRRPAPIQSNETATHLYRIAQEALNNAVKHSSARKIMVSLENRDDGTELIVRDDGVGFGDHLRSGQGMGLHIMNYRARMIGGQLDVRPGGRRGVLVRCFLPGIQEAGVQRARKKTRKFPA